MAADDTFEARFRRIEDIEEIKQLRHRLAHHSDMLDGPPDAASMVQLFTEDAQFDIGIGVTTGREAIKQQILGSATAFPRCLHLMVNPVIEVSGDTAVGKWTGLFPLFTPGAERPAWLSYYADDEYVRTPDGWRVKRVKTTPTMVPPEMMG